jgi:hypothetical protein
VNCLFVFVSLTLYLLKIAEMKLHLILKKKWAKAILIGGKKDEYRSNTPYYKKRIMDNKYSLEEIVFHVGYTKKIFVCRLRGIPYNGYGCQEWGAPSDKDVIILPLGSVVYLSPELNLDMERQQVCNCLVCKHCLPPSGRGHGDMCLESFCKFEKL